MKRLVLAASLLAAACGQPATTASTESTTAAAAQSLMEQAQAESPENQPVFAWRTLTAYQTAHPETTPPCTSIRQARSLGIIPPEVAPGSVYAPFAGSLVYSIQCGPQLTTVRDQPNEHWLVVMAPGAADAVVVTCAAANGTDACVYPVPRAAATATTAP